MYCYKTGNKNVGFAAVDSEGIASPTIVSGVKVPEGTITDTVKPVTFNPAGGATVYYGNTVTLSTTTPNATIQYHLGDGQWKTYTAGSTITVTSPTTINTKASQTGMVDSTETSASYTVRKLTGITATPPTRRVYSVGDTFDSRGMVVKATYDDGTQREVTDFTDLMTDFATVAASSLTPRSTLPTLPASAQETSVAPPFLGWKRVLARRIEQEPSGGIPAACLLPSPSEKWNAAQ